MLRVFKRSLPLQGRYSSIKTVRPFLSSITQRTFISLVKTFITRSVTQRTLWSPLAQSYLRPAHTPNTLRFFSTNTSVDNDLNGRLARYEAMLADRSTDGDWGYWQQMQPLGADLQKLAVEFGDNELMLNQVLSKQYDYTLDECDQHFDLVEIQGRLARFEAAVSAPDTIHGEWEYWKGREPVSEELQRWGREFSQNEDTLNYYLQERYNYNLQEFERFLAEQLEAQEAESSNQGSKLAKAGSVAATGFAATKILGGGKLIKLLAVLKLTKFSSMFSMILSSVAYSFFFGWKYAVGMVALLLIHETGHALVMKQRGITFGPMVFIPFMGAVVEMKDRPRDAYEEALVAFGGPALGSAGALAFAAAGWVIDSQLLMALGDFGLMINLFNLMPIGSMDGGRIAGALSKWWLVAGLGIGITAVLTGVIRSPLAYLIILAGAYTTYKRFTSGTGMPPHYFRLLQRQRYLIGLSYIGLIMGLLLAMQLLNTRKKSVQELRGEKPVDYYADDTLVEDEELMLDPWDTQEDTYDPYRDDGRRR